MNSAHSASGATGVVDSIKDTLVTMQHELSHRLRFLEPPENLANEEAIRAIASSEEGSNMVLKYQLHLQQIHDMGSEAARLSNVCSTRMGNFHQRCVEKGTAMIELGENLRSLPVVRAQIRQINHDLDKINRFLLQTEVALSNLESIHAKNARS